MPYEPPTQPSQPPPQASPEQKPAMIKVFGVLHIIYAIFGMFGICVGGLVIFFPNLMPDTPNPFLELIGQSLAYKIYTYISFLLGSVATFVLLAAGIGLLKGKLWGRTLSLVYGYYAILSALVGLLIFALVMVSPALEQLDTMHGPEQAGVIGGLIGGGCGGCFALIYPLLIVIFISRDKIKQALD